MKLKWVEVTCDYCNASDYFKPGAVAEQARHSGWIISKYGDFCCKNHLKNYLCSCKFTNSKRKRANEH